jgi:hypothetical protein
LSLLEALRSNHLWKERIRERETEEKKKQREALSVPCTFESQVLECVGRGLARFGESVPQVITYNLKWLYGMTQQEIPTRPDGFEKCLDQIFLSGSLYVKKAIIGEVKEKFGLDGEYANLKQAIEAARAK